MLQKVCVQSGTTCALTGTEIAPSQVNPNAAAYIKDIFSKLPLSNGTSVAATTSGFFPVLNTFNSRQEVGRIDHQLNEKFNLWGRFTIDDIPTVESAGLGASSIIPGMATTKTNSPGRHWSCTPSTCSRRPSTTTPGSISPRARSSSPRWD